MCSSDFSAPPRPSFLAVAFHTRPNVMVSRHPSLSTFRLASATRPSLPPPLLNRSRNFSGARQRTCITAISSNSPHIAPQAWPRLFSSLSRPLITSLTTRAGRLKNNNTVVWAFAFWPETFDDASTRFVLVQGLCTCTNTGAFVPATCLKCWVKSTTFHHRRHHPGLGQGRAPGVLLL